MMKPSTYLKYLDGQGLFFTVVLIILNVKRQSESLHFFGEHLEHIPLFLSSNIFRNQVHLSHVLDFVKMPYAIWTLMLPIVYALYTSVLFSGTFALNFYCVSYIHISFETFILIKIVANEQLVKFKILRLFYFDL